jgi:hypothetical protein
MAFMNTIFVLKLFVGRPYHTTAARIQSLVGLEDEVLMFSTFAEANGKKKVSGGRLLRNYGCMYLYIYIYTSNLITYAHIICFTHIYIYIVYCIYIYCVCIYIYILCIYI